MNIGLLGGTLESLLLALELRSLHHEVYIFEIDAEIGMPVHYPGLVKNPNVLAEYITKEQEGFLTMFENPEGWAFRMEWMMKFLSHRAAIMGVKCLTRTRVLKSSSVDSGYEVKLSSGERSFPSTVHLDMLVDFSHPDHFNPGNLRHQHQQEHVMAYSIPELQQWYGGLVVESDITNESEATLQLHRSDGVVELWWPAPPTWRAEHGFLETYEAMISANVNEISFDAAVQRVRSFADGLV